MTSTGKKPQPRRTLTASVDPTRREDKDGVVIGPWSARVKQTRALVNAHRASVRRTPY
jgi:hypothetical protein